MSVAKDLTGQRFGKLVALYPTEKRESGSIIWQCRCDCGNFAEGSVVALIKKRVRSCGCLYSKDLIGQRFGKLVVIKKTNKRAQGYVIWSCKCDCGNFKEIPSKHLLDGKTNSCGCQTAAKDLTGQRFGKLIAIHSTGKRTGGKVIWICRCDCGNFKEVHTSNLLSGTTNSCGCINHEKMRLYAIKKRKLHEEAYIKYPNKYARNCAYLTDSYVKDTLCNKSNLSTNDIPPELIEIKRAQLKTIRAIKERQKEK